MTTLQDYLESYLKSEGIFDVIPEHRRNSVFPIPVAIIWLIIFWMLSAYFLISQKGSVGIIMAIFGPPTFILLATIITSIPFLIRQIRYGKRLSNSDAGRLGLVMLFLPVVSAIILGIYLNSWAVVIWYIIIYCTGIAILFFINMQSYRVHVFIDVIRSFFGSLWRSVTLLATLIPLLLVVVLFSVFSRDLWEILAELPSLKYIISILWLAIPTILFIANSIQRESLSILGTFPDNDILIAQAETTKFISDKLNRGLIGEEEWKNLKQEVIWRPQSKVSEKLLPIIQNKVKRWLGFLLISITITLTIAFFVYFFVLFSIFLSPHQIADWTNTQVNLLPFSIIILGGTLSFTVPSTLLVTAKVSFLLACFVAIFASISSASDQTIKAIITNWLIQKSDVWLAISILYTSAISPNYYEWNYIVRDINKGIANVIIVVRQGLSFEKIKLACEHVESQLEQYKTFVMVTAFEQNDKKSAYRLDSSDSRWRLLNNKVKNNRKFDAITFEDEPIHYNHFLGRDALQNQESISDEWFGNTPDTIQFSKNLWNADTGHEWIMHPYVSQQDDVLNLEIHLSKRMAKSQQYRKYVREIFRLAKQTFPSAEMVIINLYYRETVDSLARLHWYNQSNLIDYKDETLKKSRYEHPKDWY